jgi:hypothetical protein
MKIPKELKMSFADACSGLSSTVIFIQSEKQISHRIRDNRKINADAIISGKSISYGKEQSESILRHPRQDFFWRNEETYGQLDQIQTCLHGPEIYVYDYFVKT